MEAEFEGTVAEVLETRRSEFEWREEEVVRMRHARVHSVDSCCDGCRTMNATGSENDCWAQEIQEG